MEEGDLENGAYDKQPKKEKPVIPPPRMLVIEERGMKEIMQCLPFLAWVMIKERDLYGVNLQVMWKKHFPA